MPKSPISAILLTNLLNENPKDLPSNMTELYSKYLELVLGRWEIDKGLQSQKEYQALDNIMMDIASYAIVNEVPVVPVGDVKQLFRSYLNQRNLSIELEDLYQKMIQRCEIVYVDPERQTLTFKHRTFAEYLFAKRLLRDGEFVIDEKIFDLYWTNTIFFCLGIKKDAPNELQAILRIQPRTEMERWVKVVSLGNYFLAAYASPYDTVASGIEQAIVEASQLYVDIVSGKMSSPFLGLPRMMLLYIMQSVIRHGYSFEHFKRAIEDAALRVEDSANDENIKSIALFFLAVTCLDVGSKEVLDYYIKTRSDRMPLEIEMALGHEFSEMHELSTLMKKKDKQVKKKIKHNKSLLSEVKKLYEKPMKSLISRSARDE